ncbi:hypothetical protein Lal_00023348 [Lupinus albus]|nr:hypothetical protein Lal_00023348 [Lupinus albus]
MKYSSTLAAFMLLILVVSTSEATLSCSDVIKDLKPCISYLVSGSGKPPEACCIGAKALASSATNSEDKKAACNCIKSTAKSLVESWKLEMEGVAENVEQISATYESTYVDFFIMSLLSKCGCQFTLNVCSYVI